LQDRFEEQRWLSLPLLPPGPEVSVALPLGGRVVPFDWKRFPKEFVAGLEGRWENSVPVYDLGLAEDPLTHETLFYNAAGAPILRLPAPVWSDPADLRLTLASLYGVVPGSSDSLLLDARLWDPARLQAHLTLIRPEDVEYYLYAEAKVRDYAASLQTSIPPPVMMLMGGESEFCIAAVQRATNGIRLEIELPAGFTNRVDVFGSTNLVTFEWSVLADALSTTGGSPLVWTDTPLPATLRFYAAGDADTDSDLDGLTDAREVFLHRTCPTNLDTDADGLVDGNSGVVGTNLYAGGVQSNGYVQGEMTLGTSQLLADTDDDGVSDGAEVAGGSDPLDPNLPPNVRGAVFYTGLQTGTVRVIAVATSGSWSTARQAAIFSPGAYRIANLPPSNYWIRAFVDSNGDGTNDAPEARGEWAEGAVLVTNRVTDIDFSLADPDDDADGLPDWWEILHWSDTVTEDGEGDPDLDGYLNWQEYLGRTDPEDDASHPFNVEGTVIYSGPLEGSIVVLASTSSASWAAEGSVTINSTGTFALLHLPVGAHYWVKAFRDSDEDGVFDFGEAWGEDATEYVLDAPVTNAAVTLVDHDADGDDLADWFEVAYGLDPQTGSNCFVCGWWKMNGSGAETNVVDVSGNTNDGWLVGTAATNWGEGVLHGALALTGSNYVQLADNETLAPSGLTLAMWIDPAADLTNGAAVLFSKKDPAAATGYSLAVTNGKLEWLICQAGVHVLTAPVVLTNGAWRHVAATYGAGRQRIYVDGVQAGETNWSLGTSMGYLDQGTTAPRIGASTDATPARFLPGLVDDVRLYDGEFTSNEVWSIYEAGADVDGDTLRPAAEMAAGSSPGAADTDGDGVPDAVEVAEGTLANNPDTDGDGADDGLERLLGSGAKTPNVVCDLGPEQVTAEARQSISWKSKTIAIPGFVTNGLPDFYLQQVKSMVRFGEDVSYAGTWLNTAYREVTIELGCGVRHRVNGDRHDEYSSSSYYGYSYFEGDVTGTNYGVGSIAYWGIGSSGWTNFNSSNNEIESSDATNYVWEGVALPVSDWSDEGDTNTPGYSRQATPSTLDVSWVIDGEDPEFHDEYEFHATNSDPFTTPDLVQWATNDLWAGSPFTTTNLPWGWNWSHNCCGIRSTNDSAAVESWLSMATNEVDYSLCAAQYRFRVNSPQSGVIYRATASHWFTPAGSTNRELTVVTNFAGYCTNAAAEFHLPANGALLAPPVENGTTAVSVLKVGYIEASSDKADNSPQQFPGHQAWPFVPNNSTDPGKHLVVFFKDVVDTSLNVLDFDVELDAHILPSSVPDTSLSESWRRISGPASGSFDRTDTFSVMYQNPKNGGAYKIGFGLGIAGSAESEANIVLPLAGAEIDSIVRSDIARANAFASTVVSNYSWLERQSPINGVRWFVYNARGDYRGRPDNANSRTVREYNPVASSGLGAVATWCGVPIRLGKVSNFMVGYGAKKIGVNPVFGWMSQVIGTLNDSAATKSWDAGWNIASGSAYGSTVSNLVVDVWDEADDKNQKLWPNRSNADNYVVPSSFWNENSQLTSPGYLYLTNP
jgi:hypothetical protein